MMRTLALVTVSVFMFGCGEGAPPPEGEAREPAQSVTDPSAGIQDPDVRQVHERMMEAMAPGGGWEEARYITFDWIVRREGGDQLRRSHEWDRWDGKVRVSQPSDDGQVTALFSLDAPENGEVWVDGERQEGEAAGELLAGTHRSFINDSYWFLMPYKWTDPGVTLEYLGEQTDDEGRDWEVVELHFDEVGLTPQNRYRAFVNPETDLMERWHFIRDAESEPAPTDWANWQTFGPIRLPTERLADGVPRITFENIRVEREIPGSAFQPPSG